MKTITKLTLASSVLALAVSSNAMARGNAPAPVDCCKDVAELNARVDELQSKALMSDTKSIAVTGHVNRAALWVDNDTRSNTAHVDNKNSESRLNLTGTAGFNNDTSFGATFEIGLTPNTSELAGVRDSASNSQAEDRIRVRKADLFMQSNKFGRISLGRGEMASAGIMSETDYSGTRATANGANGAGQLVGGAIFRNKVAANADSDKISEVFESGENISFDGISDRVRYDTPDFQGAHVSVAHTYRSREGVSAGGDAWDVGLHFARLFTMGQRTFKVAAAAAFVKDQTDDISNRALPGPDYGFEQWGGSLGALLPFSMSGKDNTGVSAMFGYTKRKWDFTGQDDGRVLFAKLGYTDSFFKSLGNTSISGEWGEYKNMNIDDDFANGTTGPVEPKGKTWGFFVVQNIDVVATELYAGYRFYEYDLKGTAERFDDVQSVVIGARVKL